MDKKRRLMEAVEQLSSSRQFHQITLDDVIREAGVGKGTIYRHFADKDDLFFQTAVNGFEQMCLGLQEISPDGVSFHQSLRMACRSIRRFFNQRRAMLRMILAQDEWTRLQGGSLRQRWLQHRKKMTQALAEIIARGMRSGDMRKDIPPAVLSEYLLGILRTSSEMSDGSDRWGSDETVVDLFIKGAGEKTRFEVNH